MIRFLRILGVVLIGAGALTILSWFIEPLRKIWPLVFQWFSGLPLPIQTGLVIAAIGFLLLFSSVIWERIEDRKSEGNLLDE